MAGEFNDLIAEFQEGSPLGGPGFGVAPFGAMFTGTAGLLKSPGMSTPGARFLPNPDEISPAGVTAPLES